MTERGDAHEMRMIELAAKNPARPGRVNSPADEKRRLALHQRIETRMAEILAENPRAFDPRVDLIRTEWLDERWIELFMGSVSLGTVDSYELAGLS